MNKQTCIRNADKKKNFFNRQIKNIKSGSVFRVKAPDFQTCKQYIPNNKKQSNGEISGPKISVLFIKVNLWVK